MIKVLSSSACWVCCTDMSSLKEIACLSCNEQKRDNPCMAYFDNLQYSP